MKKAIKMFFVTVFTISVYTLSGAAPVTYADDAATDMEASQEVLDSSTITTTETKLGGGGTTTINWTNVAGAQGYYIYRSSSEVGGYKLLKTITNGATTRYSYNGIKDGTIYYYKAIAYRKADGMIIKSKASAPVQVIQKKLGAASITTTETKLGGGGTTTINWTNVAGAQGYYIYRSSSEVGGYRLLKTITSGATTNYSYSGIKDGTAYYYKIIADHKVGSGIVRAKASAPARVIQKRLGSAELTRTDVRLGAIRVTWDKVPGAQGYYIYRSTTSDGGYEVIGTTKKTTFLDSGLKDNRLHYYKVIAYHKVGGYIVKSKASPPWDARTPIRVKPGVIMSVPLETDGYMYIRGEAADYNICYATDYCNTDGHFFYGGAYVYVPAGSSLNVSVEWYESDVAIIYDADLFGKSASSFSDGEYLAGFDIQPGTYVLQGRDSYSYTICDQPILNCELAGDGTIDSDYVSDGGAKQITLQEGDFINIMSFGEGVTGVKID